MCLLVCFPFHIKKLSSSVLSLVKLLHLDPFISVSFFLHPGCIRSLELLKNGSLTLYPALCHSFGEGVPDWLGSLQERGQEKARSEGWVFLLSLLLCFPLLPVNMVSRYSTLKS